MLIESAKVLVDSELTAVHILLEDGAIKQVSKLRPSDKPDLRINASGLIALPGMIDAHVHLRDLELSYKETFETGTQAAAAGGFTTVLDMPNSKPATTTSATLSEKISQAQGRLFANVGFQGALVDDAGTLKEMHDAGAIAFKLYMNRALETFDSTDDTQLNAALRAAKYCDAIVTIHAEDGAAIRSKQERSIAYRKTSVEDFLRAHSPKTEVSAVRRILNMAKQLGVRTHVCHITIADAVQLVRRTSNSTCEATPHHLLLNRSVFRKQKTLAMCVPPIRSEQHRQRLWQAFRKGRVDIVASDHAPHTLEEKATTDAWKAATGVPGLETSLPTLFTQVSLGKLSLRRLIDATATNPARIFGLAHKGVLREGFDADLVLVDPKAKFKIRPETFLSKAKYSPFEGMSCIGRAAYTFVNGVLIAERGAIVGPHSGKVISSDA